jgi:hypothetical protein
LIWERKTPLATLEVDQENATITQNLVGSVSTGLLLQALHDALVDVLSKMAG